MMFECLHNSDQKYYLYELYSQQQSKQAFHSKKYNYSHMKMTFYIWCPLIVRLTMSNIPQIFQR